MAKEMARATATEKAMFVAASVLVHFGKTQKATDKRQKGGK
jgi:hypothetical protein